MRAYLYVCSLFIRLGADVRVCAFKCVKVNVPGDTARFVGFLSQVYVQK